VRSAAACLDCYECKEGAQNHCSRKLIWTYNSKYPDGQVSQGGYADRVRCQADFAFHIPESISSQEAAPLMCAGVTVFAPLARSLTRKGMKVGIIGVGGLGHLGGMFASKLQDGSAEVTAISHNSKKKDDALKMGAKHFLDTSNQEHLKAAARFVQLRAVHGKWSVTKSTRVSPVALTQVGPPPTNKRFVRPIAKREREQQQDA
jgi:alcohol dehydrogenase (NADP+)